MGTLGTNQSLGIKPSQFHATIFAVNSETGQRIDLITVSNCGDFTTSINSGCGSSSVLTFNCPNDITKTAINQNGTTVTWNAPNATTTCMVDNGVNCEVIPNNISGFKYLGAYQGSKYFCSNTSDFTYSQAKSISMQNGGHVAVVCSSGENEFLRSSLLANEAWIGYSDEITEGDFRWVNGENCNYTNWNSGEPNNTHTSNTYNHADHTILNRSDGKWYDRHQNARYEFIMEVPCQSDMQSGNVTVNQTEGPASGSNFSVGMTTVTYEAIDECGNTKNCSFKVTVNPPVDPCSGNGAPVVTVERTNPDCGQANGKIFFLFADNPDRSNIEFSIDGGNSYPLNVSDNAGMAMFGDVYADNYDVYVRWGNDDCPVDLGNVNLNDNSAAPGTSCNDGNPTTENDVIQVDGCTCAGVIPDPCAAKGGDNDGDGICRDDDCNDFNPNIGAKQTPGAACDDGNPNTVNDEIQADGCGCFGLPKGAISLVCVNDITVTEAVGQNGVIVDFGEPNANSTCSLDGVNISQTGGLASGSLFPEGMTTITFTATDACGNSENCSFKVTVNPVPTGDITLVCNTDITVTEAVGETGVVVDYNAPSASTTCSLGGLNVMRTAGPVSGSVFPVGMTTVTYVATDACGSSETCSFKVTVNPAPVGDITFTCNEDINEVTAPNSGGIPVTFDAPIATTTCTAGGLNVVQTSGPASGSVFPVGVTFVSYTATDACGNTEICSFRVTVVEEGPTGAKVGDFVFRDNNGNGIQDLGEEGLANIFILLTNTVTGQVKFMTSGSDGMYMFGDLEPGTYNLKFVGQPGDLVGSAPNQGGDPAKDSDINPVSGITPDFTLVPGEINNDIDAGFRPRNVQPDPAVIGDLVYNDANGNGQRDNGEVGVPNVTVKLQSENGATLQTVGTDDNGNYSFITAPGTYKIMFNTPTGFLSSPQTGNAADGINEDNDSDPNTGMTNVFTVIAGETNNTIDAAFTPAPDPCLADAGTLSGGDRVTIVAGQAPVSATPDGNGILPTGFSRLYVLTSGTELVIQQTSNTPNFTVTAAGKYTVHTLIYDPTTLDLSIIVSGLTTGFDVNSILIQGGGTICGALDLAGAMTIVENPTTGCPGNVTNGGQIGSDEDPTACGPFDPAVITNVISSTGGNGQIEYIWLASTNGCPTQLTDQVAGANGESYDPGTIAQTTYYVRCSRTFGCTVWIESNCVVKTVDDCGNGDLDCNDAVVTGEEGKVTISNIAANAKVEISGPSTSWAQQLVCESNCNSMEMVTGLSAGEYNVTIQSFNPYCYNRVTVTVTAGGGGNPCDNAGGDTDGDGVCDNVDNCRTTFNADQADNDNDGIGNVCDDTPDGETGNPCDNAGGDTDGDGVCDNVDNCRTTANADQADNDNDGIGNVCDNTPDGETGGDLDCNDAIVIGEAGKVTISNIAANAKVEISGPSTSWAQQLVCESNCNSMEMVTGLSAGEYNVTIQSFNPYCYNRVTVTVTAGGGGNPCDNAGGDTDGDGVCDNVDNCRTTANADQADNDNDGIGNVCDDTPDGETGNPCDNAGGDTDGDGVCDNVDNCKTTANADQADNDNDGIGNVCDDTPDGETGGDLDCNDAIVIGEAGKVTISNIAANAKVEISGPSTSWAQQLVCESNCNSMEMVTGLSVGEYNVTIQSFNPYCYNRVTVTVTAGGGNPCDNAGGDTDGDGVCDNVDNCRTTANADQADNDNDGIGNVCDDTPDGETGNPCDNAGGDTDGDGVCDNVDNCRTTANADQADNDNDGIGNVCDDTPDGETGGDLDCNDAVVTGEAGKVTIANIAANAKIEIFGPSTGWAQELVCESNCNSMEMVSDLTAGDYNVTIQSFNPYCYIRVTVTVTEGGTDPCANAGGDADGDGVCRDDDCDDNNPNIGAKQTPGTDCNDGNAATENDVIQSDGCSCAGTPIGPEKCANRTVSNTTHCSSGGDYGFYLIHQNLERRYTFHDGLLMEFTDGTAMLTGRITNNGDAQIGFDVNINLTGRTAVSPTGDAKEHTCLNPDTDEYYYYADVTGTLTGTGGAAGAVLTVRDQGEAFQLGHGANVTNYDLSFGASGWLQIDVQSEPSTGLDLDILTGNNGNNGDININISGNGTECPNGASSRNTPTSGQLKALANSVQIFPNPAQEVLYMDLKILAGKRGNIKVRNLYGQLVQELELEEISTQLMQIDLSNFQNGIYHLTIDAENTLPITKKVLVSRLY